MDDQDVLQTADPGSSTTVGDQQDHHCEQTTTTTRFIAETPKPPYYAVIFTSLRNETGDHEYAVTAKRMVELASQQPGFLGVESVREKNREGITVSYWADLDSIRHWKQNCDHQEAQSKGYSQWYKAYKTRISLVERDYGKEME